METITWTDKL